MRGFILWFSFRVNIGTSMVCYSASQTKQNEGNAIAAQMQIKAKILYYYLQTLPQINVYKKKKNYNQLG